jgi:hypothetical protein
VWGDQLLVKSNRDRTWDKGRTRQLPDAKLGPNNARIFSSLPSMPHSHHSHSGQFCKHAIGLLEDVVKEALNQGFEVYGLTEHAPRYHVKDLYPEEVIILHVC